MRFLSIFLIIFSLSAQSFAAPAAYFKSNGDFIMNGKPAVWKFWSASFDLDKEFSSNPLAYKYFEESKYYGRLSSIIGWGSVGAAVTYAVSAINSQNFNSGTYWTIFLVPWLGSVFSGIKSRESLLKAINIYNGVSEIDASFHQEGYLMPISKVSQNGLGLSLKWEF